MSAEEMAGYLRGSKRMNMGVRSSRESLQGILLSKKMGSGIQM